MNIFFSPLAAIVIGLLVPSRLKAALLYLVVESLFFTFQTLVVLLAWMGGQSGFGGAAEQGAFGPAPTGFPLAFSEGEVWAYGLVNLALIVLGVGIAVGAAALRIRRRQRRALPAAG